MEHKSVNDARRVFTHGKWMVRRMLKRNDPVNPSRNSYRLNAITRPIEGNWMQVPFRAGQRAASCPSRRKDRRAKITADTRHVKEVAERVTAGLQGPSISCRLSDYDSWEH